MIPGTNIDLAKNLVKWLLDSQKFNKSEKSKLISLNIIEDIIKSNNIYEVDTFIQVKVR